MSGYVAGLCWKAKFGCATAKAVAVALADHANDDGEQVYPSVKRLAEKVELHERTVQRALRKLESMGIISVVSSGGAGPTDTREWRFNLGLIRDVADGKSSFVNEDDKGDSTPSMMGDTEPPMGDTLRVALDTPKGGAVSNKGDTHVTRNVTKLQETSSAPLPPSPGIEAASGHGDIGFGKWKPRIVIVRGDLSWSSWLDHIEARAGARQREAAETLGRLVVHQRWPTETSALPVLSGAVE